MSDPRYFGCSFNPSVGILWGLAGSPRQSAIPATGFNPSVGILWGLAVFVDG